MAQRGAVVVIGAGPAGLATAAHLVHAGVSTRIFGRPLDFWRAHMPRRMLLRSRKRSSSISDPRRAFGLDAWAADAGRVLANPIPIQDFIDYGEWFRRRALPEIDTRLVARVARNGGPFVVTLDDGEEVEADRVVVAAGVARFRRRPAPFDVLPDRLVSHSADHVDFERFAGRRVLVVGAGQSALESAALLNEAGAEVELVARAASLRWLSDVSLPRPPTLAERMLPPTDVGGRATGWIAAVPDLYRLLPSRSRRFVWGRCVVPAGAGWLVRRLAGVRLTTSTPVAGAHGNGDDLRVELGDGTVRHVDHVVLGTGFAVDVTRYPFLERTLVSRLEIRDGHPVLGPGLESSVPGLHFVGAPAALSFGPVMRFVVGTWYAAPAVCRRVLGRAQPRFRCSF